MEVAVGATVKSLRRRHFENLDVVVPPLAEQEQIVTILDEVFEAIGSATANTQEALQRLEAVYKVSTSSLLQQGGAAWSEVALGELCEIARGGSPRPIQSFLTDRDDGVNWIKISDASASGRTILWTAQKIKREGVSRSRMVHAGDLLLSNSMSFGRPYILGTDGCIHDGWLVLGANPTRYDQTFLYHLLGSEAVYRQFDRLAAGSTVRNLNIDLVSSILVQLPPLQTQQHIAQEIDRLEGEIIALKAQVNRKLALLAELQATLLARAFSGELTAVTKKPLPATPTKDDDFTTPEQVANVIAFAQRRHILQRQQLTFGHKKAQKALHFIEAVGGVELGRRPDKDAAGPNDFRHMLLAERWAKAHDFFDFVKDGGRYTFRKLVKYAERMRTADAALAPIKARLEWATALVVDLDSTQAEVLATVHAAWNNLILDNEAPTEEAIVRAAREEWHLDKLLIPVSKFRQAIREIRRLGIVPDGSAKRVGEPRLL